MGRRKHRAGFTLIELMLVVAIIGLISAIAIPKFANLIDKAKEATIKGTMGATRSAMTIYYADSEGIVPSSIHLLVPRYMPTITKYPETSLMTGHNPGTFNIEYVFFTMGMYGGFISICRTPLCMATYTPATWFELRTDNFLTGPTTGHAFIYNIWGQSSSQYVLACTHLDTRGQSYSTY